MKNNIISTIYKNSVLILICFLINITSISAQNNIGFTISEDLKGNSAKSLVLNGSAYLTSANGDPAGNGWLRLTTTEEVPKRQKKKGMVGYALLKNTFPSSMGVVLDLEFSIWGGTGADGFSFYLYDATYAPGGTKTFVPGGKGGSLGYAQSELHNSKGLSGGYIGVGIDEFGNFGNDDDKKSGGFTYKWPEKNQFPNAITIRGSQASKYKFLKGIKQEDLGNILGDSNFTLDKKSVSKRPTENTYYRRIILQILPKTVNNKTQYEVTLRMKISKTTDFKTVLGPFMVDEAPPANLALGFGASTGGSDNYHEVRNITVTTPGGVRVTKEADKGEVYVGDELTYTINVFNQDTKDLKGLLFKDQLPNHFQVTSVEFKNNGNEKNKAHNFSKDNLKDISVDLAAMGEGTFIVKGIVTGIPDDKIIRNTAIFKANGKTPDLDETNDIATVETKILNSSSDNCGCPVGAKEMKAENLIVTNGDVFCVSKDLYLNKGNFILNPGGKVYVQSGAKLVVEGTFIQYGGLLEVCPTGGVDVNGSAIFGCATTGKDAVITLYEKAYFTVTGSFLQENPGSTAKAVINMYDGAFVEVCGTYTQQSTTYPIVNYRGVGDVNAYFVNKSDASGGGNSIISYAENVTWITMDKVGEDGKAPISNGNAQWCGPYATKEKCPTLWPDGLTNNIEGKCHEAEGIVNAKPSIKLEKTGVFEDVNKNGYADVQDLITYSFKVYNTGNVPLQNIVIKDTKLGTALNVKYVSGDINKDGKLDKEEIWVYTATYNINMEDVKKKGVYNIAEVSAEDKDQKVVKSTSTDPNPLPETTPGHPGIDKDCPLCTIVILKGRSVFITNPHIYQQFKNN
ncbi:DUF7507 domain-containing protein [Myroides albus]|nr:DUF11 domain-containing protein [Myroides albus]